MEPARPAVFSERPSNPLPQFFTPRLQIQKQLQLRRVVLNTVRQGGHEFVVIVYRQAAVGGEFEPLG